MEPIWEHAAQEAFPGMKQYARPVARLSALFLIVFVVGGCTLAGSSGSSSTVGSAPSTVRKDFPYRIDDKEVTGFWLGPAQTAPNPSQVSLPAPDKDLVPLICAYNESLPSDWAAPGELRARPLVAILVTSQRTVRIQIAPEFPPDGASILVSGAVGDEYSYAQRVKSGKLVLQMLRLADARLSAVEKMIVDPDHKWFK